VSAAITAGYIHTCCSPTVNIAELHWFPLQNPVSMHRWPTFVRAARLPSTSLTYIPTCYTSAVYIATYAHTHCRTSLVFTTVLHSYTLLVCRQHHQTPFIRIAEPRLYVSLSYIRTRCSSAIYIADLRSYTLQNLVGIRDCPTLVRAACLPSKSPTSVRTHCRTPLVCTAVQRSYALQNCSVTYLCPTFLHAPCLPPFYIHTHC